MSDAMSMKGRRAIVSIWGVLAVAAAAPAGAQPVRLSLEEAIGRGIEASERLAELQARRAGAEATVAARRAAGRPQIAADATYLRTNHIDPFGVRQPDGNVRIIFPDIPDNYRTGLGLEWPLYSGGRVGALARAAEAETEASRSDVASARGDLRLEITRAYWSLVTAQETVRVVARSAERMEAHRRDMRARLESGLVPPNDVLAVDAQYARQRALAIGAARDRDVAALTLRRLVGLDLDTPVELTEPLSRPGLPVADPAALVAEAGKERADRQALERRIASASARVAAARTERLPSFSLAGRVDYARPNPRILPRQDEWDPSWDLGITVRWPWFDGGRAQAAAAEAAAAEAAARHRLDAYDRQLAVDVRRRRLDLEAALATIDAAEQAVESAMEARRVVAARFDVGVATSTEVLDAEVVVLQAELERTQALAAARLAEAALARAVGR